jgi:membrane protein DedA with SNARE-associated domain
MNHILTALLPYVLLYRYTAIFVITYLAALLIPLPANTTVFATAALAVGGFFNIYFIFLSALIGSVCGDLTGYLITRKYGRELLEKFSYGRRLLNSSHFARTEQRLLEYAPLTIFVTRFSTALGPLTNIVAGTLGISFWRYFPWEFFGEILDAAIFTSVGYLLGSAGESITDIAVFIIFASAFTWLTIIVGKRYFASRQQQKRTTKARKN